MYSTPRTLARLTLPIPILNQQQRCTDAQMLLLCLTCLCSGGLAPRPVDLPVSSTFESGSPHSGSSTPTSEGSAADTQISVTFLTASGMQASGGAWGDDQQVGGMGMNMSTLLDLTSRMVSPLPLHGLAS